MSEILDKKYISLLSSKLDLFEWEGPDLATCRCPLCGDSKKSKYKKRGYFYSAKGNMNFKCHNCQASSSFSFLLKKLDPVLFSAYKLESFKDGSSFGSVVKTHKKQEKENQVVKNEIKLQENENKNNGLKGLVSIKSLDDRHYAKQYVIKRKIPETHFDRLFFSENFMGWVNNNNFHTRFKKDNLPKTDPRLVIPFFDENKKLFACQGRSLIDDTNTLRYATAHVGEDNTLIYGLDRVDFSKTVYVVEGPIDSLFLPNAIAAAGSGLKRVLTKYENKNMIFVFDCEPRNKEIVSLIDDIISRNKKIVVWDKQCKQKDINDMVKAGMSVEKITEYLKSRTFSGLKAKLEFNRWKV